MDTSLFSVSKLHGSSITQNVDVKLSSVVTPAYIETLALCRCWYALRAYSVIQRWQFASFLRLIDTVDAEPHP